MAKSDDEVQDRNPRTLDVADGLFRKGEFKEAEACYSAALEKDPDNPDVLSLMGNLALLSNNLPRAKELLTKAVRLRSDAKPKMLLAETYYRLDDFAHAAPLFRESGRQAHAAKLESFADRAPYDADSNIVARLELIRTDPLPLVRLSVNDKFEGNFLIDTGASELILDLEFAARVGAMNFGSEPGTFAGGKNASYEHGRVDSIGIDDLEVRNVPVHLMDTRRFAKAAGGQEVDGIIGTVLLYHFTTAILDYPMGELVLQNPRTKVSEGQALSERRFQVPFWMAGDHYIVARGAVNNVPSMLFLDTGLAGGAFTCPQSTVEEARIILGKTSVEGVGGGGPITISPFEIESLSLGDAEENGLVGLYGAFPFSLENHFGFRIGGLISHGFFRNYKTVFDFQTMTLHLIRESLS